MTERHPPLRNPHRERAAERHPMERSPESVGAGRAVEATIIQTYGSISSGEPEGC